ncbi:MAG TPA: oxidoreductase, partial [Ornithinibacter sp.]|nr:oxidoreductase [Ornithinibacter sp.]
LDGTFNATGPTTTLAEVLTSAAQVAGSPATPLEVPPSLLAELGVASWMGPSSLPLWIDDPQWRGFATLGTARARAAGLRVRPLRDTLRDALAFEEVRDVPRAAGLTDEEERRVQETVLR